MKRIFLATVLSLAFSTAIFAQTKFADVARLEQDVIDQGKIKQNSPVPAKFVVVNTSNAPIIIEQANPTCGCTVSDYTKTPIAPGQSGYVMATFNAANPGHFTKVLHMKLAGVDEMKDITIQGDVLTPEDFDKANGTAPAPAKPAMVEPVAAATTKAKPTTAAVAKTAAVKKVSTTKKPVAKKTATTTKAAK